MSLFIQCCATLSVRISRHPADDVALTAARRTVQALRSRHPGPRRIVSPESGVTLKVRAVLGTETAEAEYKVSM